MSKVYYYIKVLSLIGIILAIYLLFEQITKPAISPCTINNTINCNAIISGSVSKTLSIPTPLYGLIGYIVILFAAFKKSNKLILGMSAFGLIFCLRIAFIEIFTLHVICPVCIGCQVIMIAVFCLALYLNTRPNSIDKNKSST